MYRTMYGTMIDWRRRATWTVTAVVLLALVPQGAEAATTGADARSELSLGFTTTAPDTSTGLELRVLYKDPEDPDAKPPPLQSARFALPTGTRIDGSALPACEASDEELRTLGRAACPEESRLGTGAFTAITGVGPPVDPFVGDVTLYNGGDQVIELVTFRGTEATAGFDRLQIRGSSLVVPQAPATPGGPPEGRTVPREIVFSVPAQAGERAFLTTPPSCPEGVAWTSRGEFTFTDGGTSAVASETPCVARRSETALPRARLRVAPRRVRARRTVRLRFRALGPARCRRGATVHVAGRRVRTNRRGRASLRVRFRRPGRRIARITKRGCRSTRTRVFVLKRNSRRLPRRQPTFTG